MAQDYLFLDKEESLRFNPQTERHGFLVYPNGDTLHYRAYEQLYYVKHVAYSTCQFLNIYVPASITEQQTDVPLFFRTYVGGYRSSAARTPSPTDATGRALKEGFVVVIPGSRGWNSTQLAAANDLRYIGCAPAALLDLKAAIRYLRYNDALIPGDATQIITDRKSVV